MLRTDGHDVTALTLPGLDSAHVDRSAITLSDHINAICEAVAAAGAPVLLAVHSGAGASGYAASDRIPERIAAMVYVDSGPATGALEPDFDGAEKSLPSLEDLARDNIDGLSEQQLETFRQRAVPQPGGVLRESAPVDQRSAARHPDHGHLHPATPPDQTKVAVKEGDALLGGFAELRDITWVDLPTSHARRCGPRPQELATIIGDVAAAAAPPAP